jgi:hypothetical protein
MNVHMYEHGIYQTCHAMAITDIYMLMHLLHAANAHMAKDAYILLSVTR